MKKRMLGIVLGTAMAAGMMAGQVCAEEAGEGFKMVFTCQDLTNPVWAAVGESLKEICADAGVDVSVMDCGADSATQISQMENFIEEGVDVIAIHPNEINALEPIMQSAMDAGIKVFCWDENSDCADVSWLIENYDLGYLIGTEAANWINEKFDGSCEVAIMDYPLYPLIVERANGIIAAIEELAPEAEIVAQESAVNAAEAMPKVETILQAHPDVKVIACIGDGSAIGANEAVKAAGLATEDFGIFACDATDEACAKIQSEDPYRMSASLGTPAVMAQQVFDICEALVNGEELDAKIYRNFMSVNEENIEAYLNGELDEELM